MTVSNAVKRHNGHFSFFINPIKIENQIPKSEIDKSPCDDDHVAQGTYQPLQNQTETKTALEKTKTALVAHRNQNRTRCDCWESTSYICGQNHGFMPSDWCMEYRIRPGRVSPSKLAQISGQLLSLANSLDFAEDSIKG